MNATYIALTTHGGDWKVVYEGARGVSKDAVQRSAEREICGDQWDQPKDIYTDTELKNLTVVSRSVAERKFRRAMRRHEDFWQYGSR